MVSRRQGIFWLLTVPFADYVPPTELPVECAWITGQREIGAGGYEHWQLCVAFTKKRSLQFVRDFFGGRAHCELLRSENAAAYCNKEATRVPGSEPILLGSKPIRRNSKTDWDAVWDAAKAGRLMDIPASVRVISYRTVRAIAADNDNPKALVRTCVVYWGPTGTGKSRRAWEEAGLEAYCKDPRSKFWCGYQTQKHVIVDEFRGGIDVAHLLRWLDRYPCRVEIKGSSRPLCAEKFWITSNLNPERWYPEIDYETSLALMRRLEIINLT